MLWWDTRKLNEGPLEAMNVTESSDQLIGATVLEYNTEAGVSFEPKVASKIPHRNRDGFSDDCEQKTQAQCRNHN